MTTPTSRRVLDVPLDPSDAATEGETVRGYLKRGGRLSGGDNTWKWPLYVALAEAGLLPGVAVDPADADGDVLGNFPEAAQAQADGLIAAAAKTLENPARSDKENTMTTEATQHRDWMQGQIRKAEEGLRDMREMAGLPPMPLVVCLCGSTRFYDAFQVANYERTMAGEIVLSVGFYPHAKTEHGHGEGVGHDSAEKITLDELHKRKIDLAGYVLVVSDETGYFGQSTAGEIAYAVAQGKPVRFAVAAAEARAREMGLVP